MTRYLEATPGIKLLSVANGDAAVISKFDLKEEEQHYSSMLFAAGVALMLSGVSAIETGWVCCWCGIGFFLVGLAYTRLGASVFGKNSDGGRLWLNRVILFPFLVLHYAMWHLRHRVLSREDTYNEVSPDIFLGRRPIDGELPANVTTVVDLTAEFSATPQARELNYICVPTLDGYAPSDVNFHELICKLSTRLDPVYIHCAAGHGRSAVVAVALLVARGLVNNLADAESIVKAKRPRISIKKPQRDLLYRWFEAWQEGAEGMTTRSEVQLKQHHSYYHSCFMLLRKVLAIAGNLFLLIGMALVGAVFLFGALLKANSDYQQDPGSTLVSWAVVLGLMCWAYLANRSND